MIKGPDKAGCFERRGESISKFASCSPDYQECELSGGLMKGVPQLQNADGPWNKDSAVYA